MLKTYKVPIILQEFLDNPVDKRVVIINGKILNIFSYIPQPNTFKANLACGGMASKATLSTKNTKSTKKNSSTTFRREHFFSQE